MSSDLEDFVAKFRVRELEVHRGTSWTWSVRPVPATLGAGVLSLRRPCASFGAITSEESTELGAVVAHLEAAVTSAFAPDRMNYLMLMMVDPHLHFHVLPRYATPRTFGGLDWLDAAWPGPPSITDHADRSSSPALLEVRDALRAAGPDAGGRP